MLEGVQILIDRMEHFPQDFIYDPSSRAYGGHTPRFYNIAQGLESILAGDGGRDPFMHLTAEEKAALLVAYRKMARQAFTANIIAQTFDREEKEDPRLMITPQKVGQGFQNAPLKAEGRQVLYYNESGLGATTSPLTQKINDQLRLEMQRMETEAKIRAWAKDSE
jgi:hypothetical protein